MKTFLNEVIKPTTKGILYLCKYDYENNTIEVFREIQFDCPGKALTAYANIPNSESQLAIKTKKNTLEFELTALHNKLNDSRWVKDLADYL